MKSQWQQYGVVPHIRPVFLLPLAEWAEESGLSVARKRANEALETVDRQLKLNSSLFIALDRWSGRFRSDDFFATVSSVIEQPQLQHRLVVVGPSTVEISSVLHEELREKLNNRDEWLSLYLSALRSHKIESLDGGSDLELHIFAAMRGMRVSIGHDISQYVEAAVYAPITADYKEEHFYRVLEERFILELVDIRNRLATTGNLRTWFPWFRSALQRFHRTSDQAFGAPLLREIAFARMLLPEAHFVRAPVSLFGKNLAHLAVMFGANDLRFTAVDAVTARTLDIPRLSEVTRMFQEEGLFPTLTT